MEYGNMVNNFAEDIGALKEGAAQRSSEISKLFEMVHSMRDMQRDMQLAAQEHQAEMHAGMKDLHSKIDEISKTVAKMKPIVDDYEKKRAGFKWYIAGLAVGAGFGGAAGLNWITSFFGK